MKKVRAQKKPQKTGPTSSCKCFPVPWKRNTLTSLITSSERRHRRRTFTAAASAEKPFAKAVGLSLAQFRTSSGGRLTFLREVKQTSLKKSVFRFQSVPFCSTSSVKCSGITSMAWRSWFARVMSPFTEKGKTIQSIRCRRAHLSSGATSGAFRLTVSWMNFKNLSAQARSIESPTHLKELCFPLKRRAVPGVWVSATFRRPCYSNISFDRSKRVKSQSKPIRNIATENNPFSFTETMI